LGGVLNKILAKTAEKKKIIDKEGQGFPTPSARRGFYSSYYKSYNSAIVANIVLL
jgi:hypothetical protein